MKSKITSTFQMIFVVCTSVFLMSQQAIAQDQGSTSQSPCECWIDVKTGKQVPTAPISGANYVKDPENAGLSSVALLSGDGKTARNSKTGQNYALEPCPPPTQKKVIEKTKEACDLEF